MSEEKDVDFFIQKAERTFPSLSGEIENGTFTSKLVCGGSELSRIKMELNIPAIIEDSFLFLGGKWNRDKILLRDFTDFYISDKNVGLAVGTYFNLTSKDEKLRGILKVYMDKEGDIPVDLHMRKIGSEYNLCAATHYVSKYDVLTKKDISKEYFRFGQNSDALNYLRKLLAV
jgi:hypothetical protein